MYRADITNYWIAYQALKWRCLMISEFILHLAVFDRFARYTKCRVYI